MKRNYLSILILVILVFQAHSQSLSVFEIDTSSFPTMKAKFYAFDASGKQIKSLSASDFNLTENGIDRTILSVSCPPEKPPQRLSSVIVADVSGSMSGTPLDITRMVGKTWVNALPLGQSECALSSFDDYNYFNQDFTTNRNKLLTAIDGIGHGGGTNYNMAMIEPVAGGLLVAKTGKYKKVIIFLTDGQPNFPPDEARIIAEAQANNITINCITIGLPAHISMKHFAEQTGGLCFDNVTTEAQAKDIAEWILARSISGTPCDISWQSGVSCVSTLTKVKLNYIPLNLDANASYQSPNASVAKLEINPSSIKFINAIPGIKRDTIITLTARNADLTVTNITSTNPSFVINPTIFQLKSGQSINITLTFVPADSGYVFAKFDIESNLCPARFTVSGGFPGKKPTIKTIKLIQPNGGETLVVGMDTVITWEGVLPDEKVKIEYSTNNGVDWITIANNATGLSYNWRVPKTPSNQCLARVTANAKYLLDSNEIQICNQIWMSRNLDVDHYQNGDSIPEVTDPKAWRALTTGAWCYYDNDPANGEIYGKLYNWHAVNDPRGLAPQGWHVPSDAEWTELETCLGGPKVAGGKLKSTGTKEAGNGLWESPNTGANNESSFSALPGGNRYGNGTFYDVGYYGYWWSSTEFNTTSAWYRYLLCSYADIFRSDYYEESGFSVRCVRD